MLAALKVERRRMLSLIVLLGTFATTPWMARTAPLALAADEGRAVAAAHRAGMTEQFHYRWTLGGFAGVIGRLFLPSHGDGVLTYQLEHGKLWSELLITSEKSDEGEYWRYGSEIDPDTGFALEAWSAYRWRGKEKAEREPVETPGVRDIVGAILALRQDPPTETRALEVWSDGKIYPVEVVPKDWEEMEVGDVTVRARRYSIHGREGAEGREWKGSMELWLADDATSTPVEIRLKRSLAHLRLRLVEMP